MNLNFKAIFIRRKHQEIKTVTVYPSCTKGISVLWRVSKAVYHREPPNDLYSLNFKTNSAQHLNSSAWAVEECHLAFLMGDAGQRPNFF